jgi:cupredoxin-like protein
MRDTMRRSARGRAVLAGLSCAAALLAGGCGRVFQDQAPSTRAGEGLKDAKFRIVAKDFACDPKVIAIDRDGRAVRVILTVASVARDHTFLIPDLDIRRNVPAGEESVIEFVADRSGIYEFGCSRFPALWMNPLEPRGKLAIK